jgi:Domain of unknown function (DUF6457)
MNDWLEDLSRRLGVDPLSPDEMGAVLKLARDVAHGVERKFAPLSTYLLGVAVGAGGSSGSGRPRAFDRAVSAARSTLPATPEPQAGPPGG